VILEDTSHLTIHSPPGFRPGNLRIGMIIFSFPLFSNAIDTQRSTHIRKGCIASWSATYQEFTWACVESTLSGIEALR
jgi:hypothetical protein